MILDYLVKKEDVNKTYRDILQDRLQISSRLLKKLKNEQKLKVNGEVMFVKKKASEGDIIYANLELVNTNDEVIPQEGPLEVLYEDDYYIAVNKPAGMVVHPCSYHPDCTLSNYLKFYLKTNNSIHPVNRLDKDTSGIVLFAKNEYAQELFTRMEERPDKVYITLVESIFENKNGTINVPIARKEGSLIERCIDLHNGQEAITHYNVLKEININGNDYSLVEVNLETGRTHQIRVHMTYIGHPIVGDGLYNQHKTDIINRQALHAYKLSFNHPISKESVNIVAQLPNDMLF